MKTEVATSLAGENKILRRVTNLQAQLAETYRYWQSRPVAERMEAIAQIVRDGYAAKGIDMDALPVNRTIVRVERTILKSR